MVNIEYLHFFLNMLLAFGASFVNFVYVIRCECTWRWLKLFYGVNCFIVGMLYVFLVWFNTIPSISMQNCVMTLLLLNIFAGGLLSISNIGARKRQKRLFEEEL